ncbi:MAG: diaminopimelate epimerase [Candidatus Delongbacteria bacterium]|nr:diaminopimelate epimerase [Candidatus Delongbacteria bacterium]
MKFYKLHGAGNDFIFFTGNKVMSGETIQKLCSRNFGIGADGVIIIRKSVSAGIDFTMKYYNSDGSEADFCANGARCSVLLASRSGYFKGNRCTFKAGDGKHESEILPGNKIKLEMKKPEKFAAGLKFKGFSQEFYFLNTGVEHVVGYTSHLDKLDIHNSGSIIRYDSLFSNGTNVNFVERTSPGKLRIRTYERGVEAETRACGTGITAAGWLDMVLTGNFGIRLITTVDGIELTVELENGKLFLTGPAELVFEGRITV